MVMKHEFNAQTKAQIQDEFGEEFDRSKLQLRPKDRLTLGRNLAFKLGPKDRVLWGGI
jgi:hypothetical protein